MLTLLTVLGLCLAAIPLAVIYLLVRQSRIVRDLEALKAELAAMRAGAAPQAPAPSVAAPNPWVALKAKEEASRSKPEEPPAKAAPEPADPHPPAEAVQAASAEQDVLPPRAVVFRRERLAELGTWLRENWFLAIAALSLALAGVFLVQYGAENGLLSPALRVSAAIALGLGLIALGERVRRRSGDQSGMTAFLPSALSGAGLVCMFAGILAARQLYGLIGPETAFAGLVATGALALVLGWFYGPLLSSVGILGAMAAPFLVGGDASGPTILFAYFALVTVVGLGIDAARRWAWVSVLSLILGFGAGTLLHLVAGGDIAFLIFAVTLVIASIAIPEQTLMPRHRGAMVSESLALQSSGKGSTIWPEFPTRLAAGATVAATLIAVLLAPAAFWPAVITLGLLFLAITVWARRADALSDLAAVPAAGYLLLLWLVPESGAPVFERFAGWSAPTAQAGLPVLAMLLLAGGVAGSAVAAWRSLRGAPYPVAWTTGAAVFAPVVTEIVDLRWAPSAVIGAEFWALHVLAIAAVMTLLAERHARVAESRDLRVSLLALAALSMVTLALFTVLVGTALTIALAVMAVLAVGLDRRFGLPQLAPFILIGVAVTVWRLVAEPGAPWAMRADLWEVSISYILPFAAFVVGWAVARGQGRTIPALALETALWIIAGTFACVVIGRMLPDGQSFLGLPPYWEASLYGSVWLIAACGQLNLLRRTGPLRRVHFALAGLFGALAAICIGAAVVLFSPLVTSTPVHGPLIFDTLMVAYGVPALLMVLAWRLLRHLDARLRAGFLWTGAALGALCVGLEIRHFWRGDVLSVPGTTPPELYSYTVALMAASALLMLGAVRRRSRALRRLALIGVGLSIAKVFLIDMGSLTGLIRVFAFLGLGLSLVALAWIDRWITAAWGPEDTPQEQESGGGGAV
ncbi:DUF2339 domain-containing protein [Pelagivirga sediminicola]|uniref:DUF2339 domain-containing protein n=1 Tax=Pelagivirga sediminicola TaxID=2170575 RepID=A0A2T7G9K0_9RHOB|nr:DUF2339 domain-containing protein [Pelagivirga sediminicola]PVA11089.1 DUF2339 domain-containing protein [Pelagivirga sediminicola]